MSRPVEVAYLLPVAGCPRLENFPVRRRGRAAIDLISSAWGAVRAEWVLHSGLPTVRCDTERSQQAKRFLQPAIGGANARGS